MRTVILLTISNLFMTVAWYGHLRFKGIPLWKTIVASWLIAFVEYCFQVPANRWGSRHFSVMQLKIIQEVITLTVFTGFSLMVFPSERFQWNHGVAFALLVGAVFFAFVNKQPPHTEAPAAQQITAVVDDTNAGGKPG